jgi:hypothetical protein
MPTDQRTRDNEKNYDKGEPLLTRACLCAREVSSAPSGKNKGFCILHVFPGKLNARS